MCAWQSVLWCTGTVALVLDVAAWKFRQHKLWSLWGFVQLLLYCVVCLDLIKLCEGRYGKLHDN